MKSTKTTLAGLSGAIGMLIAFVLPKLGLQIGDGDAQQIAGALVTIVSLILHGKFARDDNVSSEGTMAAKNIILLMVVLPALSLYSFGCAAQQSTINAQMAQTLYDGAVRTATIEAQTGVLNAEQAQAFEDARSRARPLIDAWINLEAQGLGNQFDGIDRLIELLDAMIAIEKGTNNEHARNTGNSARFGRADQNRVRGHIKGCSERHYHASGSSGYSCAFG